MLADQLLGLADEHRKDLLTEAARRRLVAARRNRGLGPRGRLGRRIVNLGVLVSGECVDKLLQSNLAERRPA